MRAANRLIIDASISPALALEHIRGMVSSRAMIDNPRFRRRQILGWRFRELRSGFSLQPEYGDAASDFGARFEGRIEEREAGSRVVGRVILSRLMLTIMSVIVVFVLLAMGAALRQGREPVLRVVLIGGVILAASVLLVRYSLRSTAVLVEMGLKEALGVGKQVPDTHGA
jgi:hypothetical protein